MKNEDIRKIIIEVLEELADREMLKPFNAGAYADISDRLYSYYDSGAKDYDVQTALKEIESDPYFQIIPLYFSELKTIETIAEMFDVEISTITRNKKRLCLQVYNKLSRL